MISKIIKAVKNDTLSYKIQDKLHLYHVNNKNITIKISEEQVYKKMEKKYVDLIEQGVVVTGKEQPSNKVWICWFQGEEHAPDLVKACIDSVRKNMPDKEIVVLTDENISQYIKFPDYIEEKRSQGVIGHAHYSDLLRTELLCKYGGMWIDATVFCTSGNIQESIRKAPLFIYQVIDLTRNDKNPIIGSSWFISTLSNQRILLLTRELLHEYWKTEKVLNNYFLFHIFFAIACRRYEKDWVDIPVFNNASPHTLQFELDRAFDMERWREISNMSCLHKLNHHNDYSQTKDSFYWYIVNKYLQGIERTPKMKDAANS